MTGENTLLDSFESNLAGDSSQFLNLSTNSIGSFLEADEDNILQQMIGVVDSNIIPAPKMELNQFQIAPISEIADFPEVAVAESELFNFFLNDGTESDSSLTSSPSHHSGSSGTSSPQHSPMFVPSSSQTFIPPPPTTTVPISTQSVKQQDLPVKAEAPRNKTTVNPIPAVNINNNSNRNTSSTTTSSTTTHSNGSSSSSKKRERPTSSNSSNKEVPANSPLELSRDELLKLSSKGLENYANTIASARQLTAEEERQLKKQRRLIKNRESAQLSRLRKKVYIDELEKKMNSIISENENLSKQLASITTDRNKLQQEVIYLRNLLKQQQQNNNTISNPSMMMNNPAAGTTLVNSAKKTMNARNLKAATVCLMIVMFSFGLFFKSDEFASHDKTLFAGRALKSIEDSIQMKVSSTNSNSEIIIPLQQKPSAVVPLSSSSSSDSQPSSNTKDMTCNNDVMDSSNKNGVGGIAASTTTTTTKKHSRQEKAAISKSIPMNTIVIGDDHHDDNHKQAKKRVKISTVEDNNNNNNHNAAMKSLVPMMIGGKSLSHNNNNNNNNENNNNNNALMIPTSVGTQLVKSSNSFQIGNGVVGGNQANSIIKLANSRTPQNSNTSYVYCPDAQQLTPSEGRTVSSSINHPLLQDGGNIALLIPSSLLNQSTGQLDTSLLEVSCQVLAYYVWPMPASNSNTNMNNAAAAAATSSERSHSRN